MKSKALLLGIVLLILVSLLSCELFLEKPEKPTIHALVIGLDYKNNYYSDGSTLYTSDDLEGTINDAKEIAAALYRRGEEMETDVRVTLMLQEGATLLPDTVAQAEADYPLYPIIENIQTQIQRINSEMTEDDIFLLYYAGHGYGDTTVPNDNQGALALAETKKAIGVAPVSVEELQAVLVTVKGSKLLIMDSCYSGTHEAEYPTSPPNDENSSVHMVYDPSQFFLLASATDQLSWEFASPEIHGYFTGQVLENLGWQHTDSSEIKVYDPDAGTRTETIIGKIEAGSEAPIERNGTIYLGDLFANIPEYTENDGGSRVTQTPQTGNGPLDLVLFSEHW